MNQRDEQDSRSARRDLPRGRRRQWQQQEQKEEDNPHGEPRIEHLASEFSLFPA